MAASPRFEASHDPTASCPSCASKGLDHFYQVDSIPTTSNLLMTTREEAIDWPRGNLRLAQCGRCGFITNTAFDPATQQLTARYEATQACSPTFGKFASELAQGWIDRYQLHGKQILEIGCGQGEFISMMCEMASATGWGVDPIADASPGGAGSRVKFIAEKYGSNLAHLNPDFIVCRHTLEHVADVARFLNEVRAAIGDRRVVVVAIEVPDTLRVLSDAAFWDIYYEHCSYFDTDSLAAAMGAAGFEVVDSRLKYAGQYLIVEARPTSRSTGASPVNSVHGRGARATEAFRPRIASFTHACRAKINQWRQLLADDDRNVVWGSGSKAVGFLATLGVRDEVVAVVDINPAKHGTFLPGSGHEIVSPQRLREITPDRVIVMNPIYLDEIGRSISEMGLRARLIALE